MRSSSTAFLRQRPDELELKVFPTLRHARPAFPGSPFSDALGSLARMSEVTQLLQSIDAGDPKAAERLLPLVYEELRKLAAAKMAQERPGQTLQATALVHEAWMRLAGEEEEPVWNSRGHFFGAAAEAMRRILIESARRKARLRHGGELERASVDEIEIAAPLPEDRLLQVSEALDGLELEAPEAAHVVKLRYFTGLTQEQVAETMGISLRTAERHWTWAKAWLFRRIRAQEQKKTTA